MRYWQDFQPGDCFTTASLNVSTEDILEFAAEFDPQPYHLDNRAASESIFGGLCASGWQVTALMMRLVTDALLQQNAAALGSTGVRQLRWKVPVFAGDTLSARLTVMGTRPATQQGLGELECTVEMHNQEGVAVLESSLSLLVQQCLGKHGDEGAGHG
ncbi:MAG TPA: MaoC family dehydratase [Xanthomonadales bacterium]|nr:MaoC family dehydratase [Xanthomonadales bacterium]